MAKAVASSLYSSRCIKGQDVLSELDRSRPFFMVVLSVLLTLAIVGAIFYIGLRVKVVNLGYRINQEIQAKERTIEENKRLSLEIARLKSPTRIEFEAKERLGLQLPAPHQIVYIGENAAALDANLAKIKPLPAVKPEAVAAALPPAKAKSPAEKPSDLKKEKAMAAAPAAKPKVPEVKTAAAALPAAKPKAQSVAALKTPAPAKAVPAKPEAKPETKASAAQVIAKPAKKEPTASVTAEKTASPILVAKIVRAKEEKTLLAKKPTEAKPRSAGEGIPAAMLDTMP